MFRIDFSLVDSSGRVIGEGGTGPIRIIDDRTRSQRTKVSQSVFLSGLVRENSRQLPNPSLNSFRDFSPESSLVVPAFIEQEPQIVENDMWTESHNGSTWSNANNVVLPSTSYSYASLFGQPTPNISPSMAVLPADEPPNVASLFPEISAVMPNVGPILGGIEVSVFGKNFTPQHHCMFGAFPSAYTHFWNDGHLTCLVPPSSEPCQVPVTIEGFPISIGMIGGSTSGIRDWKELQLFEYIADTEVEL